ncbi:hypothetical protein [Methanobrevibacter sp.]|uniref:hypothetical protein n=1 Tax=Methanobrevibacter sp. TaxID=66852 RepID=UPI0025D95429|nr:hypothetical protein [Methanobrevibacter sp.]MBQ2665822.1 hypothetical protein [Methanobrevibacter sp.]
MNYFKGIFKISIILILLLVSVGSIYAADNVDSALDDSPDDFELDEDLDDFEDDDDEFEDDDDFEDDDFEDDDDEFEDDDDFEDDDEYDEDEDFEDDDWDDDYDYTDFDYLEYKILSYLDQYGNCTDENWTESEEFLSEYQIYLSDPSNYTLNESAEGYKTYLKIYDSITSTFEDYNLTENETAYLKFLIMYYLNNYGNVSANYTWNESEGFANYTPKDYMLGGYSFGCASADELMPMGSYYSFKDLYNQFNPILGNSTDSNSTAGNATNADVADDGSWWSNIIILILVLALVVLVII